MNFFSLSAAPEITPQLCEIPSILHSSFSILPRGVPSSINARLNHFPSHAFLLTFLCKFVMTSLYFSSSSIFIILIHLFKISYKKNASHTLSPFPCTPTFESPSFQSPEPILGNPFSPKSKALSIAFLQCSYIVPLVSEILYKLYLSTSPSFNSSPSK